MHQINIRVNKEINQLLEYLAKRKNISKAVCTRQILIDQLTDKILPILLEDYKQGKIGLKKILHLTSLTPDQILEIIVKENIEPPIEADLDDYTDEIAQQIISEEKFNR
ncbi:MAG: hypothetical protein DRO88_12975 [Promethearchaeia archaeon]|nr:MAG: hypothetical protein DRO88_12975 [Candidatus Lokiarchaeia archaeon]